ncbi:AsmA family protein [Pusillimonas sp. CC-YST705]|uniref:AsmA family protein n=1 Tax=Mesopusillimonas faecipullorum TaxID=2755040 RepID=A0ABS8CBM8_9BURK|nr:AsmA family protein [Mesopusillimonas faecipullorum]MCB5363441.1 AsmA family protein [Mesopusillimonas faecipullorum]
MKVGFKRVLIGLLTVVVLALAGVAVFLLTLDPNSYKGKIQSWVYEHYQRTLSIDGDLQLSLFPRIALAGRDVTLTEKESKEPFISVDSARFAVAIWPLLFDRFVVDHVSVSGFKANLVRHEEGGFNFDDLLGAEPASTADAPASQAQGEGAHARQEEGSLNVDIAGLELRDGEIFYLDRKTGQSAELSKLQVNTGRVTFDQPFDVTLSAVLKGQAPDIDASISGQALVKLDPGRDSYSAQKLSLQASGRLDQLQAQVLSVRGNVAYDGASHMVDASQIEWRFEGQVEGDRPVQGIEASLAVPKFKMDPSRLEFVTEKLALRAKAQVPAGESAEEFELAVDAPQLSISPEQASGQPVQASFKQTGQRTLGVSMRLEGLGGHARQLTLKAAQFDAQIKKGEQLTQIVLASPVEWDVSNDKAVLSAIKGDVRINDAYLPSGSYEFPFIGSLHVGAEGLDSDLNAVLSGTPLNFSLGVRQWQDPSWQFALQADAVDIDKLFPPVPAPQEPEPEAATPAETPASTDEKTAPAPEADAETAAPAVAQAETKPAPASDEQPATAVAQASGFRWLQDLDLTGKVDIGSLKGRGLEAQQVKAKVLAKDGVLLVDGLSAQLYDGTFTGRLSVDAKSAMTARASLKGVQAEPFSRLVGLSHPITGKTNLDVDLRTQGGTQEERLLQLAGTTKLRIQSGSIRGVDVEGTLSSLGQAVQAALAGRRVDVSMQASADARTAFSSLTLDTVIKQGVADVKQLAVQSSLFQVAQGKPATVDLVNSRIDMRLDVRVTGTLKSPDGGKTINIRGLTIPVMITGPLGQPAYQVQWDRLGGKVAEQALKRGLLDMLGGSSAAGGALQIPEVLGGSGETPSQAEQTLRGLGGALKNILRP